MTMNLRAVLSRGIKYLYLRYVWPAEVDATEWSPEAQMKRITLENIDLFNGSFEVGMRLDDAPGIGFFIKHLLVGLLKCNDGITPPNYRELQFRYFAPVEGEGDKEERVLLTVQRCNGKTPHELKTEAERKAANYRARFDGLLNKLALAFDPSGDTDCDEETLLRAASMVRELRERAENAEALGDDFRKERRENEALIEKLQAERDELAEQLNKLRDTWAQTVKTNGELGLAHTEALCEIGQLRSIIWHFALRANLAVADAMKQLNQPQQDKVREIWRDSADAHKRAEVPA